MRLRLPVPLGSPGDIGIPESFSPRSLGKSLRVTYMRPGSYTRDDRLPGGGRIDPGRWPYQYVRASDAFSVSPELLSVAA